MAGEKDEYIDLTILSDDDYQEEDAREESEASFEDVSISDDENDDTSHKRFK